MGLDDNNFSMTKNVQMSSYILAACVSQGMEWRKIEMKENLFDTWAIHSLTPKDKKAAVLLLCSATCLNRSF